MKRIKLEYLIAALALLFLSFTIGYFTGRNSRAPASDGTILIEAAAPKTEPAGEAPTSAAAETAAPATAEEKGEAAESAPAEETDGTAESAPAEPVQEVTFPLNLNTATAEELQMLPGIGEVLAQRIVSYRNDCGAFQTCEDLMLVSGIGEKRYEAVKSMITVEDMP